jgi:pre-mRNA-splicing factor CDC5/CEF1
LIIVDRTTIKQLRAGLMNLPKPKNDFEIVLPGEEGPESEATEIEGLVEDSADRDRRLAEEREEQG